MQEVSYRNMQGEMETLREVFQAATASEAHEKMKARLAELENEVEVVAVKRKRLPGKFGKWLQKHEAKLRVKYAGAANEEQFLKSCYEQFCSGS